MEAETAEEGAMDNVLHKKIVDAVKNYMSEAVTLVEGFVSVQVNGTNFRHIHISYRDLSLESDENTSECASPQPPMPAVSPAPKVSRRKAYMPIKCKARSESVEAAKQQEESIHLEDLPSQEDSLRVEKEEEQMVTMSEQGNFEQFLSSKTSEAPQPSQLEHLLLPEPRPNSTEASLSLPNPSLAVDNDPIGPLNAETIQARMNQVMPPSYPGLLPSGSDLHLSPLALNAMIPLTSVLPSQQRLKPLHEQRKIKPKPVMNSGCLSNTSPYTKPTPALSKRNPNKEFACNQCQLKFKSLHSLTEHTTSVHICFRCTTCNAKFTQRSNLQRHSLKHLGFKPFRCGVCMKEYYRKDHLVRHVEVSHPGSEPKASIVNIMPSAECLRILEETQTKQRAQELPEKLTPTSTPDTSSDHPKSDDNGPSPGRSDLLNLALSTEPNCLAIPKRNGDADNHLDLAIDDRAVGFVNLEEDGRETEEDGEDIDEEDEFGLEDDSLIFARHLTLPPSSDSMAESGSSVSNNLAS